MIKAIWNNPFVNAIRNVRRVLDMDQKKRGVIMILLLLVNAAFDILGLSTIMGVMISALESDSITQEVYTRALR